MFINILSHCFQFHDDSKFQKLRMLLHIIKVSYTNSSSAILLIMPTNIWMTQAYIGYFYCVHFNL